jgi:NADH/F420H2 dehydrogenase subunit C
MNEEIKQYISEIQPNATFEETSEWLNVNIAPNEFRSVAELLRNSRFEFDYLFCLTCVDWKTHLTTVYHLSSSQNRDLNIVVKVKLDRNNPEVETVSDIWRTAEFHEREVYEMFGVKFLNHPDLRTLILEDGFEGYPLRKDFEDPINMIKL